MFCVLARLFLQRQPRFLSCLSTQLLIWRCFTIATNGKKELEINGGIRDREIRLIGADGSQLGVMSAREAQRMADEANLDLVKIAPQAVPPVCKIMDYGKYRFEQQKKEKGAKTKAGHKLKVSIRFRGREMAHTNLGLEVHKRFAAALPEAVVDKQPKLEGRSMLMFMSPAPAKTPAKTSKTQEEKKNG